MFACSGLLQGDYLLSGVAICTPLKILHPPEILPTSGLDDNVPKYNQFYLKTEIYYHSSLIFSNLDEYLINFIYYYLRDG